MKTNTTISAGEGARVQSEQLSTPRKWDLFIGNEPFGFVHASSEREALDRVAAFQRPFRAVLAADQD